MYRFLLNPLLIITLALSASTVTFAQDSGQPGNGFTSVPNAVTRLSTLTGSAAKPTSQGLVSVIVKLKGSSLASYTGGLAGMAATSPSATGASRLDVSTSASQIYLAYLAQRQAVFEAAVHQSIPSVTVTHRYRVVLNAVSMMLPITEVNNLFKLNDVQAVYHDHLQQPRPFDGPPAFIGADDAWSTLGGQDVAGEGVIVAILDSGIWPEHPSFADPSPVGGAYPAPPPQWNGTACDFGNTAFNSDDVAFTCNNKLIGAEAFLETYDSVEGVPATDFFSARDSDGHGTHTASTAAGNGGVDATIFGIPRGTISGVAPRAHVVAYKVCGDEGCFESDSIAGIDQGIADGVDVFNFSIGGGSEPYSDPVSFAFLDAYAAGVFVAASAGNDGPDPDTVEHREPWVTSVAASTTDRHFLTTLAITSTDTSTLDLIGATVTTGITEATQVISADEVGDPLCEDDTADGAFTGYIVICERGGDFGRVEKGYHVFLRGAVGMILYNPTLMGLATDNHWLPAVHLENDAGEQLLDFYANHPDTYAHFDTGTPTPVAGDVMAAFSSRGGPGQSLGISKPDVTAPGVQILAGQTPRPGTPLSGPPGELFQAIQGTSMSSPHVAGAAALLADMHPTWTPGQIRSALMTSANTNVFQEDGVTPATPFDDGSGRINLTFAGDPGLTFDEAWFNYVVKEDNLWDSNYPSLYVPDMPGSITVQRTVRDQTGVTTQWSLNVSSPSDLEIVVPDTITVAANGTAAFSITLNAPDVPQGEVRHAQLSLLEVGGTRGVQFPITIVRGEPSTVILEKSCDPAVLVGSSRVDLQACKLEYSIVSPK